MAADPDRHRTHRFLAATGFILGSFALLDYLAFVAPAPARAAANWSANPGGMAFITAFMLAPFAIAVWPVCYIGLMFVGPWKDD